MAAAPAHPDEVSWVELCDALIHTRQHHGPKHLAEPGPDEASLRALFAAAAAAPDHGQITPWRFWVLGPAARARLATVFEDHLLSRDPAALPQQRAQARDKAFLGPVLILAVLRLAPRGPDEREIPPWERLVSLGCALQNLMLAAQARGFGSGLSSGQALQGAALREAFGLAADEQAVCFVSLGTPQRQRAIRARPAVDDFVRWL